MHLSFSLLILDRSVHKDYTWGCPAFDVNAHTPIPEDYHNVYTIGYKHGVTDWRIQLNVSRDCTDFYIRLRNQLEQVVILLDRNVARYVSYS